MTWRVAVAIELETDDPRLSPERMKRDGNATAAATAITRQAVLDNLPRTVRVIMVTGPELMQAIFQHHELAQAIVREHDLPLPPMFHRPPADYVAPDDAGRRRKGKKH